MAVAGAHERLYSHSSVEIPATKHILMLPLNYSCGLLHNILIQHTCLTSSVSLFTFQIIQLFIISHPKIILIEFEKWRAIRASVGGVGGVGSMLAWVACLRG